MRIESVPRHVGFRANCITKCDKPKSIDQVLPRKRSETTIIKALDLNCYYNFIIML